MQDKEGQQVTFMLRPDVKQRLIADQSTSAFHIAIRVYCAGVDNSVFVVFLMVSLVAVAI
jgi:hypothetical protein